jgi:hypothetical protein
MPIEAQYLADFSGGEIYAISSVEPKDNQWLLLEGLILDQNRRLRAQWPGVSWSVQSVADDSSSS